MNGKRSYVTAKGSNSKYNEDVITVKQKTEGKYIEHENNLSTIPIIKQSENGKLLPKYTAVLARSVEDGVNMDDLDQLQQDLEKLLSTSACRSRYLLTEIESIDKVEDNHDKKEKTFDKTPLKRKRPDDKPKFKESKNGTRIVKKQYGLPVNNLIGDTHVRHEVPKVSLPKNDNSDKFWASIEPYCANVSKDDIAFLDNLIQESSKEINVKIPELGEHYANEWSEELANDEQGMGRSPKSKSSDLKKNRLSAMIETFSSRLLASTIEERVLQSFPNAQDKLKCSLSATDLNLKSSNGSRTGICMDRRLRKELVEQSILTLDDLPKNSNEDEILSEIKKCQQELAAVNEYNLEELNKLKAVVNKDLQKQQVKNELEKIDNQVLDLYNKVLLAKKQAQQTESGEFDKNLLSEQITKEFEAQADALLKQQIILHSWAFPEYSNTNQNENHDYYSVNIN